MSATVERVVIVLDAVSEHRAALDTAARLAARWKARLHGIFVEDAELLRLATLPFARQVTLHAGVETLTVPQVERQLRAFAERTRREVTAAGQTHHVEVSFEVARSASSGEAIAAAAADFFVTCSLTRPIGGHFRLECHAWASGEPAPGSVLLTHRHWDAAGAVIALLDDAEPRSGRLIEAAAAIAEAAGGELIVLGPAALVHGAGFERWLAAHSAGHAAHIAVETLPATRAQLLRRVAEHAGRIVALSAGTAEPERLRDLARTGCDILLVR